MRIAIVGGGFSGVATLGNLAYLLKVNQINDIELMLFESDRQLGGLAYGRAPLAEHLMNVPIKIIGPFIEESVYKILKIDKLLTWLNKQNSAIQYQEHDFCPRRLYGQYLTYIAEQCAKIMGKKLIFLSHYVKKILIESEDKSTYQVVCEQGTFQVNAIIWATGYSDHIFSGPKSLQHLPDSHYIRNLWDPSNGLENFLKGNLKNQSVFILGSALSGMDVIVSLYEKIITKKFTGTIYLCSRHGLLHSPIYKGQEYGEVSLQDQKKYEKMSVQEQIEALKHTLAQAKIDPDLFSYSSQGYILAKYLFKKLFRDPSLDANQQKILLALHYSNQFTDVFATGMPASTGIKINELSCENILFIKTGEVKSVAVTGPFIKIQLSTDNQPLLVSRIINATGDTDFKSSLSSYFNNAYVYTDEIDEYGHFVKTKSGGKFLLGILCIGPIRAENVLKQYGLNRSTARSILELNKQAHEQAGQLLFELGLMPRPTSIERKIQNITGIKYQNVEGEFKRIAILRGGEKPKHTTLISDTVVLPNQLPTQQTVTLWENTNTTLFSAGRATINNSSHNINTQYFDSKGTSFAKHSNISLEEGRLLNPQLDQNDSLRLQINGGSLEMAMMVPPQKTVTIESTDYNLKTIFQLGKKYNKLRMPGGADLIDGNGFFIQPVLELSSAAGKESKQQDYDLFDKKLYSSATKISIYCPTDQYNFLANWFCSQSLILKNSPIFIYLPLELLLEAHFTENFTLDNLIKFFYKKYHSTFSHNFVFIISGYEQIKVTDHFNYIKDCLFTIIKDYSIVYLSDPKQSIDNLDPSQRIVFSFSAFHYLAIDILKSLAQLMFKEQGQDLTLLFCKLIALELLIPQPIDANTQASFVLELSQDHSSQKYWLSFLLQAVNIHFQPDAYDLSKNTKANLIVHSVKNVIMLAYTYGLEIIDALQLCCKLIEFSCQRDILPKDAKIFNYADKLLERAEKSKIDWPIAAQYYGAQIKFHITKRSEIIYYQELIQKIKVFIYHHQLEKILAHDDRVQILYFQLGLAFLETNDLQSALKYLLKIANGSFLKNDPRYCLRFYDNLGTIYQALNKPQEAKEQFQQVLSIHKSKILEDPNIGYTYNALGSLYLTECKLDLATQAYSSSVKESWHYKSRGKWERYTAWARYGLARIACYHFDSEAAIRQLDQFKDKINVIFPDGTWPKSYIDCLEQMNKRISSINPPPALPMAKIESVVFFHKRNKQKIPESQTFLKAKL